jgi:hypothetical protein
LQDIFVIKITKNSVTEEARNAMKIRT